MSILLTCVGVVQEEESTPLELQQRIHESFVNVFGCGAGGGEHPVGAVAADTRVSR